MKFKNGSPPGEFASKALYRTGPGGWSLSNQYFFTLAEAERGGECKWPVEVYDDGLIYVPDASEMEDAE